MSGTIRSRMEATRDRHTPLNPKNPYCPTCGRPGDVRFPCPDWVAADDTLTDLNNAPAVLAGTEEQMRVIPDPDSRGAT